MLAATATVLVQCASTAIIPTIAIAVYCVVRMTVAIIMTVGVAVGLTMNVRPCPPLPVRRCAMRGSCSNSAPVQSACRPSASAALGQPRAGSLRRRVADSSPDMARRCMEELPGTVRELLRLLGDLDTVLELVAQFGGGTWYIPMMWPLPGTRGGKSTHPLRRVVTQEQMSGLTRYYGGTQLYIPRCQRALQRLRNARIIMTFSAGVAKGRSSRELVRRLALRHNLTDRRVWDILKMQAL